MLSATVQTYYVCYVYAVAGIFRVGFGALVDRLWIATLQLYVLDTAEILLDPVRIVQIWYSESLRQNGDLLEGWTPWQLQGSHSIDLSRYK